MTLFEYKKNVIDRSMTVFQRHYPDFFETEERVIDQSMTFCKGAPSFSLLEENVIDW